MCKRLFSFFLFFAVHFVFAQKNVLNDFPKGYTPEEVGKRLSYHFVDRKHALYAGKWIAYPEAFYWNGALRHAAITGDQDLIKLLQNKYETLVATEQKLLPIMNHVDLNMFGSLPLELYQITKEQRYLDQGIPYAETQWILPENPRVKEKEWADKGYTWQTRLWIDDMYMITIVQTQAFKATGDRKYIDRAAKEMVLYLDSLQRPNGLFYHAPDAPYFWGRGNGWVAAGMTELLRYLPKDNKDRPRIMQGYLTMMKSLKEYQTASGMWNQLIDEPDYWAETSGSAMFTYAFITGVRHGWLNKKEYAPVARKAWMALVSYINDKDDVREVCVGTNKNKDKQFYYDRPRHAGDFHGQAPYLWCTFALLEKLPD